MTRRRPVWDRKPARWGSAWRWGRGHVFTATTIGVVGGLFGIASTIYTLVRASRVAVTVEPDALYFPAENGGYTFLRVTVVNDSQRPTNLLRTRLWIDGRLVSASDGLVDERQGILSDDQLIRTVGRTPVQIPSEGSARVATLISLRGEAASDLTDEISLAARSAPPVQASPCQDLLAEERATKRLQRLGYDYAATSTTRLLRGHRVVLGLQFDPGGWRTVPVKPGDMPDTSTPQATIDSLAGWRALLDVRGDVPQGLAVGHSPPGPRMVTVTLFSSALRSPRTITWPVTGTPACVPFGRLRSGSYQWAVSSGGRTVSVGRFLVPCPNRSPLRLKRWIAPDDPDGGIDCLTPAGRIDPPPANGGRPRTDRVRAQPARSG